MKRLICLILTTLMIMMLASCGAKAEQPTEDVQESTTRIITYDPAKHLGTWDKYEIEGDVRSWLRVAYTFGCIDDVKEQVGEDVLYYVRLRLLYDIEDFRNDIIDEWKNNPIEGYYNSVYNNWYNNFFDPVGDVACKMKPRGDTKLTDWDIYEEEDYEHFKMYWKKTQNPLIKKLYNNNTKQKRDIRHNLNDYAETVNRKEYERLKSLGYNILDEEGSALLTPEQILDLKKIGDNRIAYIVDWVYLNKPYGE